jgi:HK97 gp10 family phage protein
MGEFSFIGVPALLALARDAATDGVQQCAEDFTGKAQAATPVDTGTLRGSIHIESVTASGSTVSATVATGGEAEYAIYVHEGTYKMAGRPFMSAPLIENRGVYEQVLARALRGRF